MEKHSDKQRVFITGGAGFIGANLTRYLLERPESNITVYDNLSTGSKANLDKAIADSGQNGRVKFIQADILDFDTMLRAVAGHKALVHLAAHTRVRESIENPRENLMVNSAGTFNVLEAARKQGVDKFVFASSNAAVGEQKPPINESMIAKPISPYGAVKLYGEALCSAYHHCYGLKTVSLRFANAYGLYSEHKTSVIAKFLRRIREGKSLEIYGDGYQSRDFIHAEDIARAMYLVISRDSSDQRWCGEVFQVATGRETMIIDLAKMVRSFADCKEGGLSYAPAIKGEIRKNYSDISKARELLGFNPEVKLEEGLKDLCSKVV